MTMASIHQHRRDAVALFDPRTFYTIRPTAIDDVALAMGLKTVSPAPLRLLPRNTTSSENWQIFPQGGSYFIRSYDYGSGYQLGLTSDSRYVPRLYARNGNLSQQWNILPVSGGFELVNGLWGNSTFYSVTGSGVLGMNGDDTGAVWNITRNER
jgi:hypothetical protein